MIKIGDKVKFKDELWAYKKEIGMQGWLLGPPIKEDCKNEFIVISINVQDDEWIELELENYPWLVYTKEMEIVK